MLSKEQIEEYRRELIDSSTDEHHDAFNELCDLALKSLQPEARRVCQDGIACKKPGECEARDKCAVFGIPLSSAKASTEYPPQHANADGWTDWISPTDIDMYGLQCCDCGLKHEVQFRVMRNKAYTDGVHWFADPVPAEEGYRVAFRMRRDDGSSEPQNGSPK